MTIVESIKCVLQQNNDGLTSKQIYDEIIRQGLYSFGAENPVGVVNAQLRRRCIGLDFPTAYPIKFFEIAGYEGKKIKFRLISTENTATIITAPKTTDISELLPEEKIKAALQEHLQNIRQQVFDTLLSEDGIKTLNAYALKGYRLITDYPLFDKPTSREEFLDAFNVAMQFYEKKDS